MIKKTQKQIAQGLEAKVEWLEKDLAAWARRYNELGKKYEKRGAQIQQLKALYEVADELLRLRTVPVLSSFKVFVVTKALSWSKLIKARLGKS